MNSLDMLNGQRRHNVARISKAQVRKITPRTKTPKEKPVQISSPKRTLRDGRCSKGQMRTAMLFSQVLGGLDYEMEITWDWLTGPANLNLYVDIYFPTLNLAVEYHGEQHFKFPNFFHKTKREYLDAKHRDRIKRGLLKTYGVKFIEWRFDEPFSPKRAIDKLLKIGLEDYINPLSLSQTPKRTTSKSNRVSRVRPKKRGS